MKSFINCLAHFPLMFPSQDKAKLPSYGLELEKTELEYKKWRDGNLLVFKPTFGYIFGKVTHQIYKLRTHQVQYK